MKIVRINSIPKIKHNVTQFSKPNVTFESKLNTEKFKTFFYDLYRKIFPYGLSGPRKLPNFITAPEDLPGIKIQKIVFPKNEEIYLDSLPMDEYLKYRSKLINEGKYKIVDYE